MTAGHAGTDTVLDDHRGGRTALLACDGCWTVDPRGPFTSYEAWEDAARRLGWFVGEDLVACTRCAAA